jgi:hypothetical protein
MQTITEKIKIHIETITSEELIEFYNRNFEINISNSRLGNDFYKTALFSMITSGYDEFKKRLISQEETAYEQLMNFDLSDVENKPISLLTTYIGLKYSGSEEVIQKFNSIGLRNPFLSHFTELEKIESWIFNVIKEGMFLPMLSTIIIVDNAYDERITKEILQNFIESKSKESYDGRTNVSEFEIEIRNMLRRRKYVSSNQKTPRVEDLLYGTLLDKVEQLNGRIGSEIDLFEPMLDALNNRHSGALRKLLKMLIEPVVQGFGRPKTIELFKPFFYLIFENNYNGLLTEEGFELENDKNSDFVGTYRGNYNSYYSTRVKTLTGI